jgi:diphosphomevalonate decarboxylase
MKNIKKLTKKSTALAPSNIAFIKYWGKKDAKLKLPENGSISMTLDENISTTTTVEFDSNLGEDVITINGKVDQKKNAKVSKFLDLIRKESQINQKARVVSTNTFPSGTGISSSASGFAALALAGSTAAGLDLNPKNLSILARQGSGSACRSIASGFVEWLDGDTSETSFAKTIFESNYWDLADIVAVVSNGIKDISSTEGQISATTSPFYEVRLQKIAQKITKIKELITQKNFSEFGKLIEAEALELHSIMLTSQPALIYLSPESLKLMKIVRKCRQEGLEVYFTLNTGENIHLICEQKNMQEVQQKLQELDFVKNILAAKIGKGAKLIEDHLF